MSASRPGGLPKGFPFVYHNKQMDPIRNAIIRCLNKHHDDEPALLAEIEQLRKAEGDKVFQGLLSVLTHFEFEAGDAKEKWRKIISYRKEMEAMLGRTVNLATAACDYFSTIQKDLHNPKIVEISIFEETAKLAHYDSLTELFNRRYFDSALSREMSRSKRYDFDLSVIFFDLDDFKALNDSFGHQVGDLALKNVAKEIMKQTRVEDTAARYGGEEIVMILPQTHKEKAFFVGDRVRKNIEEMTLEHGGIPIKITLSGGVASFPIDSMNGQGLVECADRGLYQAKNQGKNNVALYSSEKRRFPRIDFSGQINAFLLSEPGKSFTGKAKNISMMGLLFESVESMEIGEELRLDVPIPPHNNRLPITGRVARVIPSNHSFDIGVSFIKMADRQSSHEALRDFGKYLGSQFQSTV